MNNGNIGEKRGLYVREVVACDHVGINYLILSDVRNFYMRLGGYIVFEQDLCKIVCRECFIKQMPT